MDQRKYPANFRPPFDSTAYTREMCFDPDRYEIPDPRKVEYGWAAWFALLRWPDGFQCRSCGGARARHLECRPKVWQCSFCGTQTSVTANTILHGSRLSARQLLVAMMLFSSEEGISSNRLRRILGTRYATAWRLTHRFREALRHQPPIEAVATGGAGIVTIAEPGDENRATERRVKLYGAMDCDGCLRVTIAEREQELPLQQLLATARPVERHSVRVTRPLHRFRRFVRRVHCRVSRRWMRFYVGAWASFLQRRNRLTWLAQHVVQATPRPWRRIVPPDVVGLSP